MMRRPVNTEDVSKTAADGLRRVVDGDEVEIGRFDWREPVVSGRGEDPWGPCFDDAGCWRGLFGNVAAE